MTIEEQPGTLTDKILLSLDGRRLTPQLPDYHPLMLSHGCPEKHQT